MLKNKLRALPCAIGALTLLLAACESNSSIGSSLLGDQVEIIVDSSFVITGESKAELRVQPRTVDQLLGAIDVPGFGRIASSAVCQFVPTIELDTANFKAADIDTVLLNLRYNTGNYIGDSLAPMGLTVYPLTELLPDTLTSGFNPAGYYDADKILGSTVYITSTYGITNPGATQTVAVELPVEFGRYIFNQFIANPANFASGKVFTNNVFKGFYLESSYGTGRLTHVGRTTLTMHFWKTQYNEDKKKNDTISQTHEYMMVAPEVINNNDISLTLAPDIISDVNAGKVMMTAPTGYYAALDIPVDDVLASYRRGTSGLTTLNTVSLAIPVDTIATGMGVAAPDYVLLVREDKKDEFFAENMLPDNETSFYAPYTKGKYTFNGFGEYVASLLDKESVDEADCRFCLVPVQINFELDASSYQQSTIVSEVLPYVSTPVAGIVDTEAAKLILTYSRQKSNR